MHCHYDLDKRPAVPWLGFSFTSAGLRRGVVAALLVFAAPVALAVETSAQSQRLTTMQQELREKFPQVSHLSIADVQRLGASALLVDVRAADEFAVSHLPGAVHADSAAALDALRLAHPERELVLYCSVGYRSSVAAQALRERAPDARVHNLSGSLFAWANQGLPLMRGDEATTAVHPYNRWWGRRYLERRAACDESGMPSGVLASCESPQQAP